MLFSTRYVWFFIPTINGSLTCTQGDNSLLLSAQDGSCLFEFTGMGIPAGTLSSSCESDGVPIGSASCLTTTLMAPTGEKLKLQHSPSLHAEIHRQNHMLEISCYVKESGFFNRILGKRMLIGIYHTPDTNALFVEKSRVRRGLNLIGLDVGPQHSTEKALRLCRQFADRRRSVQDKLESLRVSPTIE